VAGRRQFIYKYNIYFVHHRQPNTLSLEIISAYALYCENNTKHMVWIYSADKVHSLETWRYIMLLPLGPKGLGNWTGSVVCGPNGVSWWVEFAVTLVDYMLLMFIERGRGGAVSWGTALQSGRWRVRFPMVSLEFFIGIILPITLWLSL
jgi:hypothetical protein